MTRTVVVGDGRLLPMTGTRTGDIAAVEGTWVIIIDEGRIAEVRSGGLLRGDPDESPHSTPTESPPSLSQG